MVGLNAGQRQHVQHASGNLLAHLFELGIRPRFVQARNQGGDGIADARYCLELVAPDQLASWSPTDAICSAAAR